MTRIEWPPDKERRRHKRCTVHLPLRYQLKGTVRYADTLTKDIGGGGAQFITDEFFARNSEILFELMIAETSEPVKGKAKIVWLNKVPHNDIYSIGIEFMDIARESRQRIVNFVDKKTSA